MKAAIPSNENWRLDALSHYRILDSVEEQNFDDLTFLAAQICGVPMAVLSLVDRDRQWFKSSIGMSSRQTHRDQAFCAHAILEPNDVLVVPDAMEDDRFSDNPLVTDEPKIRFYAGSPLVTTEGAPLGTLCVLDRAPRNLSPNQLEALNALSRQAMAQMELRRALLELSEHVEERAKYEARLEQYQLKLESINAQLSVDSQTDSLTQLRNRGEFNERLDEEYSRMVRSGRPLSLLLIDIDKFKSLNDTLGHQVGDETLREVARIIQSNTRPYDLSARYGGEEFAVIAPNTTDEGANILAERFRRAIQNFAWPLRPITVSIGHCTVTSPEHSIPELIRGADKGLYESKETGRNRVTGVELPVPPH